MAMERINLNYDKKTGYWGSVHLTVADNVNGVKGSSLHYMYDDGNDHFGMLAVGCGVKDVMVKCGRDWYVLRVVRHLGEKHDYRLTIGRIIDEKTGRRESFGVINYKGSVRIDRQFVEHFREEAEVYRKVCALRERGMSRCDFGHAVI